MPQSSHGTLCVYLPAISLLSFIPTAPLPWTILPSNGSTRSSANPVIAKYLPSSNRKNCGFPSASYVDPTICPRLFISIGNVVGWQQRYGNLAPGKSNGVKLPL